MRKISTVPRREFPRCLVYQRLKVHPLEAPRGEGETQVFEGESSAIHGEVGKGRVDVKSRAGDRCDTHFFAG
jgi:hypothetical protein